MKKLTLMMIAGFAAWVAVAQLDLTPYETRARKDTVANSAQIVTDVDMAGVGGAVQAAIDAYGGKVLSVNGATGVVTVTAASIGALTNVPTLAQAAAAGGFAGTETIGPSEVAMSSALGSASLLSGYFRIGYDDETSYTLMNGDGITLSKVNDAYRWVIGGNNLLYADAGGSANWSFARPAGTYNVAATADITAHNADAAAHPDLLVNRPLIIIGTTNVLPTVANRTNGVLYVELP